MVAMRPIDGTSKHVGKEDSGIPSVAFANRSEAEVGEVKSRPNERSGETEGG